MVMTTQFAMRQMISIRRLLCEGLVGNVDLWNKNASQENSGMSSPMDHHISINNLGQKMGTKYNEHQFISCQMLLYDYLNMVWEYFLP